MRAFRTFLILVLGLIAGGYLGFWFAKLLSADDVQLLALEQQINRLHEQVETGELMLAGSADILARHIEQTEQLRDENQSLIRALERARRKTSPSKQHWPTQVSPHRPMSDRSNMHWQQLATRTA